MTHNQGDSLAEEIVRLRSDTATYQRVWWRNDPQAQQRCDDDPALEASLDERRLVYTTDLYYDAHADVWTKSRQGLQARLVREQLAVAGANRPDPIAYYTIGSMGAGKTRVLREMVHAHRSLGGDHPASLSRVAADEVRIQLPEYANGLGSEVVSLEAFAITYDLVYPRARDLRADLVYDTIGLMLPDGTVSFERSLIELREAGYVPHVLLAECPLELCLARCEQRALGDGRFVDPAVQRAQHKQPGNALRRLADLGHIEHWAVVDTSGSPENPPMIEAAGDWLTNYAKVVEELNTSAA